MKREILITGASSDLGMAYITKNIAEYDRVIAHYNHGSEKFAELLKMYDSKIVAIQADFSNRKCVDRLIGKLMDEKIMPTHLLHLVSLPVKSERFDKVSVEEYQEMMQVSLYSITEILKFCIPMMKKQKYGRILFLLSAYTTIPNPKFASPYVVSKYALLGLMKSVAAEYVSKGIVVNGISPQMMETKFLSDIADLVIEQHKVGSPLGRLIQKTDVLPLMKLLLSNEASAITGENISVSGGGYSL